jgi:PAS domain S-box-containing protein
LSTIYENRSKKSLIQELDDLRRREQRLRAVVEHCPIPVFLKDTQGRYLVANQEFRKWYDASEADIIGGSLDLVLASGRAESDHQRDIEVLETGIANNRELNWTFPDGVTRATIGTKFPVFDEDGDAVGVGGVRVDVTALRAAESALEKTQADLERANHDLEIRVNRRTKELAAEVEGHRSTSEALRTNEALLRLVMDSLPVLIAYLDSDMRYRMMNKTGAKWYGGDRSKIMGESPEKIFRHSKSGWTKQLKDSLRNGMFTREHRTTYPDGVTRDIRTIYSPNKNDEGEVNGAFVLSEDVSDQRKTDRERRETEILLRSFVANAPAQVQVRDLEGRYLIVNEAFAQPRGYTPDEMIGMTTKDHNETADKSTPEHAAAVLAHDQKIRETRQAVTEERDTDLPDGKRYQLLVTKFPVFDSDGNITSIGTFSADIRALKSAEGTIHKALIKAQEAIRSKQAFLANMSHDLRTPLNAIIGFSDIMRMEVFGQITNDRYRDYVTDISQSAHHLLEQVNDILDLSKIEAGKTKLSFEDFNISELVAVTLRELQPRVDKKSLKVTTDIDQSVATICADRIAVRQMLTNLLTNAVKFTRGNGAIKINISPSSAKDLNITVSDTGIGIPEFDIPNVILPFSQAGGFEVAQETGSGLGLSIVRLLVTMHGGRFIIESAHGVGTSAQIILPRTPSSETLTQNV